VNLFTVFLGLALAWVPAYTDRLDVATLDGDLVRYLGLVVSVVGSVLVVGTKYLLATRHSGPANDRSNDRLFTSGFYQFIRHPQYLAGILLSTGWSLVFRSGAGLVLVLIELAILIFRIHTEESVLISEYGEEYTTYQNRTWRLLPVLY
jgi:protein-S-isoprenylcysteine O-methyltransferase Ste14